MWWTCCDEVIPVVPDCGHCAEDTVPEFLQVTIPSGIWSDASSPDAARYFCKDPQPDPSICDPLASSTPQPSDLEGTFVIEYVDSIANDCRYFGYSHYCEAERSLVADVCIGWELRVIFFDSPKSVEVRQRLFITTPVGTFGFCDATWILSSIAGLPDCRLSRDIPVSASNCSTPARLPLLLESTLANIDDVTIVGSLGPITLDSVYPPTF